MKKADKAESERRIRQISNWLLEGESTFDIIEFCRNNWGIKKAQTYRYIEKARNFWNEVCENDYIYNLNWHLVVRLKLYNKCIKENNYSIALQILKDVAAIQGLYEIKIKSESEDKQEYRLIIERAVDEMTEENKNRFFDLLGDRN